MNFERPEPDGSRSLRPKIQEQPQGAEVLTEVHGAEIVRNNSGWQTTLEGKRQDGTSGREMFNTRVTKEMAERDVPAGVDIRYRDELENKNS
jgi:hypothetical protein